MKYQDIKEMFFIKKQLISSRNSTGLKEIFFIGKIKISEKQAEKLIEELKLKSKNWGNGSEYYLPKMKGCGKDGCGKLKGYYPNGDTWYCDKCEKSVTNEETKECLNNSLGVQKESLK